MIRSFRSKPLQRLYERDDPRGLDPTHAQKLRRILFALDAAMGPKDLARPELHLHPLKGDLKGFWAVTVRANWRVWFRFENADVHDVDYGDYH